MGFFVGDVVLSAVNLFCFSHLGVFWGVDPGEGNFFFLYN